MIDPNDVKSIFLAAAEKLPAERDAFLAQASGNDTVLRARVEALLKAHDNPDSFLANPAAEFGATIDLIPDEPPLAERPGTLIGPYKLLEQIGEGGMGVVYMADQQAPVRRRVALKIIKAGMDTRQVIARFEAERQALALMDHSNIARVLDAGATESGRPYFVMELVRGIPITEYCDQNNLSVHDRLELFVQVCHAVQHAHQKGIIHRDLKPSNVLVTVNDGRAVPKVIDFGVAKATGQQLTEKTLFTAFAQMVGTPLYMSPEQAEMTSNDIDTRSDIYSLGVLLYELLTGTTPFDQERLRTAAFDEVRRIIREEEPPRPSTRLSSTDALPSIAANRSLEPKKLSGLLRGELDWIVMRCLEKDRGRRYDTANTLALDVERYLNDQPVDACPPTRTYRLKKFIRRNRVGVMAGSAVVSALALGLALATSGFVQARRQAIRADLESGNARSEAAKATAAQRQTEAALVDKDHALHEKDAALNLAEEKELLQRRRFYAAQMNLAQQSLIAGDPARVLDILDQNRPRPGEIDLRGFEWYYLWRQIHPGLRAQCFHPEGGEHWGLAISPDGSTVAASGGTAGVHGTIQLWDTDTGQLIRAMTIESWGVSLLAFSPDGDTIAIGSSDSTIVLLRVADGSEVARNAKNLGMVRSLCFSPDGKQLAVGFECGSVEVLDAISLKTISQLKRHGGPVINVFYSPDGTMLYSATAWGADGNLTRIHDLSTNPPKVMDELKDFRATDVSRDGRLLTGGWYSKVTVWEIAKRKPVWQFAGQAAVINDAKFTADGRSIISAGRDDRLAIVWNIGTHKEIIRLPHSIEVMAIACPRDVNNLWASLSNDGTVKVWDRNRTEEEGTIQLDKPIGGMALMPTGATLLLGGEFPARTWDLKAGKLTEDSLPATMVSSISADGQLIASVESIESSESKWKFGVKIWNAASSVPRQVIQIGGQQWPYYVCISPDGKHLAATAVEWEGPTDVIDVWDLTNESSTPPAPRRIEYLHPRFSGACGCAHLAFSPDSRFLAAAYQFGMVNLYDLETNQIVPLPIPESPWATRVAFSKDGKLLACGNQLGVVSVFDTKGAEVTASLPGHEASISALAFFPDGRTLAVGSLGTIRIWDLPSKQERITLKVSADALLSEPSFVDDLAVTPDGRMLISRQRDGTVHVWKGAGEAAEQGKAAVPQVDRAADKVTDAQFYARRAIVLTGLGLWAAALADFQTAERLGLKWDKPTLTRFLQALPSEPRIAGSSGPVDAIQLREHVMSMALSACDAKTLNALAWHFVGTGIPDRTVTALAVRAAERAAQLAPADGKLENTLGVAYYRAGDWLAAIESIKKSMELRDGGDGIDWFFLAMAHWQIGDNVDARMWYDKAVEWMDKNQLMNEEVRRFHKEAAELLGITEPKPSIEPATRP